MTVAELISAAKQLAVDERKQLVQEVQETLPIEDEPLALSPEWMAEIQRRAAELDAHPERGIPWEQVHNEALARIRKHVG